METWEAIQARLAGKAQKLLAYIQELETGTPDEVLETAQLVERQALAIQYDAALLAEEVEGFLHLQSCKRVAVNQ